MIRPYAVLCAAAGLGLLATSAAAQEPPGTQFDDPLATRAELETFADSLARNASATDSARAMLDRVRARLRLGDFRPGDRVQLEVVGESTLTDTFTVDPERHLRLPPPTIGTLPLEGVLRIEFEPRVIDYLSRFLQNPVVRARPLLRVSVQGEVTRAGFYEVPADAVLSQPLMAAGGTTARAKMEELRIERDGESIWSGAMLQRAIAAGQTLADAYIRDGDQYFVPGRDLGMRERLSFLWIVVSLASGIYGLTRIF